MYYKRIRDLRIDNDLSQKEICKIMNVNQQQYSKYEIGDRDFPISWLIKLSNYYNVSIDYMLGLSNKKERLK